ncbi:MULTISPECIES: MHYT domain-containing protein [Catenuloplanes]|uniref:NO-binding membrane sensor protein with MHYT domain n=1 Tax=Catenuloplanes niger TaxID=587534 RepID=A0AAE4CTE2_9ACTN|nr:MHYT domain-containing protein [Catenuloplanes niger]MDR7322198.1 NO-binding membrane sensor protein with MHYT domain [Catenuloplanes niger]
MAEVHHFTHGAFNPIVSFLMAFLGSLLGLGCTVRARESQTRGRRARWLGIAAFAIGGAGIWLMHFMAMLGFDVPDSTLRYDLGLTLASAAIAVGTVGFGLFVVGFGPRSWQRILTSGVLTGAGVVAMHYTGMRAMRVVGVIHYDPGLVAASCVIAVVAATVALWFTVTIKGWGPIVVAAAIMGVAVTGMHYTGMAAMRVELWNDGRGPVDGLAPYILIIPITLLAAATLIGMAFSGLQAMTQEEFAAGAPILPFRPTGAHAERTWSIRATEPVIPPAPAVDRLATSSAVAAATAGASRART